MDYPKLPRALDRRFKLSEEREKEIVNMYLELRSYKKVSMFVKELSESGIRWLCIRKLDPKKYAEMIQKSIFNKAKRFCTDENFRKEHYKKQKEIRDRKKTLPIHEDLNKYFAQRQAKYRLKKPEEVKAQNKEWYERNKHTKFWNKYRNR